MIPVDLPRCGRLYSWTVIGNSEDAPEGFGEFVPCAFGIIELDVPRAMNPVRVTGRLTDIPRDLTTGKLDRSYVEIGAPFEKVTRVMKRNGKAGPIEYGPLWRPVLAAELARQGIGSSIVDPITTQERIKNLSAKVVQQPYHPEEDSDPKSLVATFADPDNNFFQLVSQMITSFALSPKPHSPVILSDESARSRRI